MAPDKEVIGLEDVIISLNGNRVGGAKAAEVEFAQENRVITEGGSKKPREIKDGLITVKGRLDRLFLDVETIKELVDIRNGDNPYFTFTGVTKNKFPKRRVTVIDAKFKGFKLNFGMGEDSIISQEFDALDIDM